MTTSRIRCERTALVSPIIDFEPPPIRAPHSPNVAGSAPSPNVAGSAPTSNVAGSAPSSNVAGSAPSSNVAGSAPCPPPTAQALRRHTPGPLRTASVAALHESAPPRTAVVFADAALRRVLEIIDRRRPVAQLRPLLAPELTDIVVALTRSSHGAARPQGNRTTATLRRIRLRMVDDGSDGTAAEVFGTYTRGRRVRAIAARIALRQDRWRIVALQIG